MSLIERRRCSVVLFVCSILLTGFQPIAAQGVRPAEGYVPTDDGLRLFYRIEGSGHHPVVVLHGGPGLSMAYLRPDLARLSTDWKVVYFDQRGAGRSTVTKEPSSLTVSKHVDDVDTMRRFIDVERLLLVGHSWGAGLALQYAVRFPNRVSALLLVNPIPARRTPYMGQFASNLTAWMDEATRNELAALRAARLDADDPVAACRRFWSLYIRGYFADPARLSFFQGDVCDDPAEAVRNNSRVRSSTLDSLGDWDWRESLATVRVRTMVIHADADPIPLESAREWAAAMPNARLFVIEDSGHFPFVEQPEIFFVAADEFLRGGWPRDARVVQE